MAMADIDSGINGDACVVEETPGALPSKRLLGMCRWTGSHFSQLD